MAACEKKRERNEESLREKVLRETKKTNPWSILWRGIGIVFSLFWILCAVVPYVCYRVFNLASIALLVLFVPLLLLLVFWPLTVRGIRAIRKTRGGRWLCVCFGVVVCAGAVYVVAVSTWMGIVCANQPPERGSDAVCVVLGCQVNGEYNPSPVLANRLEAAENYLRANPEAVCIVTGCQGEDEAWPEAVVMRNCLVRAGIAEERILLEENARNTEENLRYAAQMMRARNLGEQAVIVTDWWHQLRASLLAEREGLKSWAVSSPAPRPIVWALDPVYYARELLGMARMLVIGR